MVVDAQLLAQWRDGDGDAGDRLLERYLDVLHRFFVNKVGADADDLVQQTMMALLKGKDQFEARCGFRAYVLGIARFQLYAYFRSRRRVDAIIEYDSVSAFDLVPSASTLVAERRAHEMLLEALRRIPVNLQIALELHYWEDMNGPELAAVLGVPVDTAYSRIRRARELLKKQLRILCAPGNRASPRWNTDRWEPELRSMASQR